jgi:uncharacterized protein YgiM (DUF1202 family)
MKKTFGLIFATLLSTAVLAQVVNTTPAPVPIPAAPDTNAVMPAPPVPPEAATTSSTGVAKVKKTAKKKVKKKATLPTSPEMPPPSPLVTNEPAVAVKNEVNVRGQARINSEVIGHLKKGDAVTVLEVVTLKHPKTDEPANWARIALPTGLHVWINARYIDLVNDLVSARKLNLRSGPGENFSVVGMLHKGDPIKQISTKGDWTEIEPPTNSFGFVAAHLLSHVEAAPAPLAAAPLPPVAPAPVVTPPAPATTVVENSAPIAPAATEVPAAPAAPATPAAGEAPSPTALSAATIASPPPSVPLAPPAPMVEKPLPIRIVQREGVVGGTASIQAPTVYELRSLDNGHVMDYLYTTSTNISLKLYKGLTIYVSGEEELDERWPNTPVITIQKIQVVR